MHRLLVIFASLVVICASNVSAQEICWTDAGGPPLSGEEERAFILAGTSTHRNSWSAQNSLYRHRSTREPTLTSVLQTLGHADMIPGTTSRRTMRCDSEYQGAMLIRQVRALGPDHPYIERLAENQITALSNCTRSRNQEAQLPKRNWSDLFSGDVKAAQQAEADFAYLTGVAYFYARQYDEARKAFAPVGNDPSSPHRQAGRLMEVRALRALDAPDEAYALAKRYRIEADEKWKVALDEQEDLIALHSATTDYSTEHLEKIFRRVSGLPIENEPSGFRVQQASEDFDLYFMNEFARLKKRDVAELPHDWWLREVPPEMGRPTFIAVHALAKRYDGIDWVQAYHASVAFNRDNTWFAGPDIDTEDPAYVHVTDHAYRKWKAGSPRWAMIVAKRMTPDSKYIPEMAAYARELQRKAASCSLTPVEYVIYARITHHLVRVLAANEKYDEAIDVWTARSRNWLYPPVDQVTRTQEAFARLLIIRSQYDLIEKIETIRLETDRKRIATNRSTASSELWTIKTPEGLIKQFPARFTGMLNLLSADSIEAALTPPPGKPRLMYQEGAKAAEVLWMRGFMFSDEDLMARAEPLLLRSHPALKRYFRQASAAKTPEARDFALAVMVLRNPGLTPYSDDVRKRRGSSIDKLDTGNPIEGNWWCDADDRAHLPGNEQRLQAAFFDFALMPEPYPRGQEKDRVRRPDYSPAKENREIDQAWQRFRSDYAPFSIISENEQERLATLPRGSEWLAAKVRAYIESPDGIEDRKAPRDERIPESLHRLVQATRYSCHTLERGNAKTSRWAYTRLHADYGDTTWAAETPYWFDAPGR